MLLPDEWEWLRSVTPAEGVKRCGMGAGERVLPYATAVQTGMLRADLADARRAWFKAIRYDPEERARRQQSDFLVPTKHEWETLDFHSLRHTCGAWLAMTGAHPKAVQAVMRHSTIMPRIGRREVWTSEEVGELRPR